MLERRWDRFNGCRGSRIAYNKGTCGWCLSYSLNSVCCMLHRYGLCLWYDLSIGAVLSYITYTAWQYTSGSLHDAANIYLVTQMYVYLYMCMYVCMYVRMYISMLELNNYFNYIEHCVSSSQSWCWCWFVIIVIAFLVSNIHKRPHKLLMFSSVRFPEAMG